MRAVRRWRRARRPSWPPPVFSEELSALSVRFPLLARRLHKWLGLFVAAQAVIWSLTGLYMTAIHIDIIHGDHFIRRAEPRPLALDGLADPVSLLGRLPDGSSLRTSFLLDRPVYVASSPSGSAAFDARTGERLAAPDEALVRTLARYWYTGEERIEAARLISDIPGEIRGRRPPVWQVDFSGWNSPTLYFSPETGELLARRHNLWRGFDFLWMLHIMDYETRDNVNNPLLRVFTWAALLFALSGLWLLAYSLPRRRRRKARP